MRDLETMREQENHKRDIKRERKLARDAKRAAQDEAFRVEHAKRDQQETSFRNERLAARDAANTPWERN